jgi:beta-lactamase regulating signal transducer with metallopeptidase domain
MANDVLVALVHLNLAAAAAFLAVLALRPTVRRLFAPQIAYRLWASVPVAALAALIPAQPATRIVPPGVGPHFDPIWIASQGLAQAPAEALLVLWLAGAVVGAGLIAVRQLRFLDLARRGLAGPAVAGVVAPRIVMPADADHRYTAEERRLIRAHERTHIARGDPRANGFIALAQCLCWFNPLVHLAARQARLDQELACDAAVLARLSGQRRRYAETLLKTQLGAVAAPLGCHWLAGSAAHPLEMRIAALRQPAPDDHRKDVGAGLMAAVIAASALTAWTAQPHSAAQGLPPAYIPPTEAEPHVSLTIVRGWRAYPGGFRPSVRPGMPAASK